MNGISSVLFYLFFNGHAETSGGMPQEHIGWLINPLMGISLNIKCFVIRLNF